MSDDANKGSDRQSQKFKSQKHAEVHGRFETIYDLNDAFAAICFIIGSVLFFSDETQTAGTWLFLIGSVSFLIRPLIHVIRDFRISRIPAPQKSGQSQ